jgi:multiple sugar transport system ATP-binding protein
LRGLTGSRGGERVTVGIRPEHISGSATTSRGETAAVTITVELVEPLGHEVVVYGRAGDDLITAKQAPHRMPAIGDKLELAVELDAVQLFDGASERRLEA